MSIRCLLWLVCSACCWVESRAARHTVTICLEHGVGDRPLVLDSTHYLNALGQDYTISKLKYYISGIALRRNDGAIYQCPGYFLVDASDTASYRIRLTSVPEGDYTAIRFLVGVDSAHNCSGAQSGALDPANGMFWAWNTGYIFFKLEGHSPSSLAPAHLLEYHIGGYRSPNNRITQVDWIPMQENPAPEGAENSLVRIGVDVSRLFRSGAAAVDFSRTPSVTDPQHAAGWTTGIGSLFYPFPAP